MRTVRSLVVGVGIIALVAFAAGCDDSTASSKGCYGPAVYVTGEAPDGLGHGDAFSMASNEGVRTAYEWEASDPRLSGTISRVEDDESDMSFGEGSCNWAWASVGAHTWVLDNDGGRWVGPATSFAASNDDVMVATVMLSGEGGYEGWTAYLVVETGDDGDAPASFEGLLFPGSMPSPPTPPVE